MEEWRAWRTTSGQAEPWLRFLRPPPDPLSSPQIALMLTDDDSPYLAVSADGQRLVSGGSTGTIRLWDLSAGNLQIAELMLGDECYVGCISFTPHQDAIMVGLGDGSVRFLDPIRLNELRKLQVSNEAVTAAVFLEEGKLILVGDSAGNLSVWDIEQSIHITYTNAYKEITSLALHSDGSTFAVGGGGWNDNMVGLWQYSNGDLVQTRTYPKEILQRGTVFSPDGQLLAWANQMTVLRSMICKMVALSASCNWHCLPDRLPGSLAFCLVCAWWRVLVAWIG
jgi:WD40 repeat protein